MRPYSFYRLSDGMFTGKVRSISMSRRIEDIIVPEGCGVIEGWHDHLSKRLDLTSGEIVDYQPPRPDANHEWIHDDEHGNRVRRWALKPEVIECRARRAAAVARIVELERKEPRARREHEQGIRPSEADRKAGALTLQEIWDEIARLRDELSAASGASL